MSPKAATTITAGSASTATVVQLKAFLADRGEPTDGLKADLVARVEKLLADAPAADGEAAADADPAAAPPADAGAGSAPTAVEGAAPPTNGDGAEDTTEAMDGGSGDGGGGGDGDGANGAPDAADPLAAAPRKRRTPANEPLPPDAAWLLLSRIGTDATEDAVADFLEPYSGPVLRVNLIRQHPKAPFDAGTAQVAVADRAAATAAVDALAGKGYWPGVATPVGLKVKEGVVVNPASRGGGGGGWGGRPGWGGPGGHHGGHAPPPGGEVDPRDLPPPGVEPSVSKVFVSNLPAGTGEAELRPLLEGCGPVHEIHFAPPRGPMDQFVAAFVWFATRAGCDAALARLNGLEWGESRVLCRVARPRIRPVAHHPPAWGGGWGGYGGYGGHAAHAAHHAAAHHHGPPGYGGAPYGGGPPPVGGGPPGGAGGDPAAAGGYYGAPGAGQAPGGGAQQHGAAPAPAPGGGAGGGADPYAPWGGGGAGAGAGPADPAYAQYYAAAGYAPPSDSGAGGGGGAAAGKDGGAGGGGKAGAGGGKQEGWAGAEAAARAQQQAAAGLPAQPAQPWGGGGTYDPYASAYGGGAGGAQ